MTRDRDIERIVETWLAPGPTTMPDHLFDSIVDRVERQPQARTARIRQRFHEMRPVLRIGAIAAVLVLTLGIGAAVVGGALDDDSPAPTTQPSPAASASPAASPSSGAEAPLPASLAYSWVGAPRAFPSLGIATEALPLLDLDLTNTLGGSHAVVTIDLGQPFLTSEPSATADGRLRVETAIGESACANGDVGEYDYTVSPDGMTLTLAAVSDACDMRAEIYTGTWTRTDCPDNDFLCLGDLPAGTYVSTFLDVRTTETGQVANRGSYGQLRYTVPDGWANSGDWVSSYELEPAATVAANPADDDRLTWHGIYIHSRAAAAVQDEDCTDADQPGVPRTLDGLTAFLQGRPGLVTSTPVELTVGGYRATMTDIAIAADWTATCPDAVGGHPVVTLFHEAGAPEGEGWGWGIGWPSGTERQRIILVEIGPDNVLLVALDDTSSPSRFDELVAAAMPIVESFEFPE
jgi:hypothetical protein